MKRISFIFIGFILLLTGCAQQGSAVSNTGILRKNLYKMTDDQGKSVKGWTFHPPITIKVASLTNGDPEFQSGESMEDNIWTRAYHELLGIKLQYKFHTASREEYDSKISVAAAGNQLPDLFSVDYVLFRTLIDENKLFNMTKTFDVYADGKLKENVKKNPEYQSCIFNEKLYGIAGQSNESKLGVLWVRNDWLNNKSLQLPKSINALDRIVESFATKDPDEDKEKDTLGLALDAKLSSLNTFSGWFGAFVGLQITTKEGKVYPSEVMPQWKTALKKLNSWYKKGYIDRDYNEITDLTEEFKNEKYGLIFGDESTPKLLSGSVTPSNLCNWVSAPFLMSENLVNTASSYTCVSSTCLYPEALPLLLNLIPVLLEKPDYRQYYQMQDAKGKTYSSYLYQPFSLTKTYEYQQSTQNKINQAIISQNTNNLNGEQFAIFQDIRTWMTSRLPSTMPAWTLYGPNGLYRNRGTDLVERNRGTDPVKRDKGTDLAMQSVVKSSYLEYFHKIITNQYFSVEAGFDAWLNYCKSQGVEVPE